MKNKKSLYERIRLFMIYIKFMLVLWLFISNLTQALNCPKMTQTELFIHIPKSFIGDWNHCK